MHHDATTANKEQNSESVCLRATDLQFAYPSPTGAPTNVLDGVSFMVAEHETVSIVGPNGCGKSTLLLAVAGLLGLDSGTVSIRGKPPCEVSVGLVFQNYRESLLPWRTTESNIGFSLELKGVGREERAEKVSSFLQELHVELPLDRYPYQLSGGQQQTVSILRALFAAPDVLLLDEPFASLDYRARLNMHQRIQEIFHQTQQTVLLVSHEIDEAILLSDRVLVISHRPAKVLAEIGVGFPKPRPRELVLTDAFLRIKREIFARFPL